MNTETTTLKAVAAERPVRPQSSDALAFACAAARDAQEIAANYSDQVTKMRNEREVLARWIAEACRVLFTVEEEAEDGGDSLRVLRERGLNLVRAVLFPSGPNVGNEGRR